MRSRERDHEEAELNLVPIMNLFTALIPFLLLSAAFVQVKVVNASVPAISEGGSEEDAPPQEKPVVVNLSLETNAYNVTATGDGIPEEELAALQSVIERTGDDFEALALRNHLREIKARFPRSDTVIIVPAPRVEYGAVIRAMDIARRDGIGESGEFLFPRVVVAGRHEPSEEEVTDGT